MRSYQITEYCHRFVKEYIAEGDCCVDATAGNGGDTEFLCRCVGRTGKVYAFDIQEQALVHTQKRSGRDDFLMDRDVRSALCFFRKGMSRWLPM